MANKAEISKLFKDAMALDGKVDAAKKAVDAAMEARSVAVKALYDANGQDNGPFNYKGELYTIRKRAAKDDEGNVIPDKVTWFFVSLGDKAVTSIE